MRNADPLLLDSFWRSELIKLLRPLGLCYARSIPNAGSNSVEAGMAGNNNNDKTQAEQRAVDQPSNPSRRNLLKGVGVVGAVALSGAATSNLIAAEAPADAGSAADSSVAREALEVRKAPEAETLEAISAGLVPPEDNGPGGGDRGRGGGEAPGAARAAPRHRSTPRPWR